MSKKQKPVNAVDSRGRRRDPRQDAALRSLNRARALPKGVTHGSYNVHLSPEAHAAFRALSPAARGAAVRHGIESLWPKLLAGPEVAGEEGEGSGE